jgi:hypothetical protein
MNFMNTHRCSARIRYEERRGFTDAADNPPAFQVEMDNLGVHDYRWR